MSDQFIARTTKKAPRRVRFLLRDSRLLEGSIFVTERDFLAPYLSSRKRCVNVTAVHWLESEAGAIDHIVLPLAQILWATPVDEIPLLNVPPAAIPHDVEVELDDGIVAHAVIHVMSNQRLSDFFDASDDFVALSRARLMPREHDVGDIALNRSAVVMIRELK